MRKGIKITSWVVAGILLVLLLVGIRYVASFNGFLDKITNWGKETKEYSVVVLGKGEDKNDEGELQALQGKNVGFLKADAQVGVAEQYLAEKVEVSSGRYDDAETLVGALGSKLVEGAVLETSRLEALRESATEAEQKQNETNAAKAVENTHVIYTFEIEVESGVTEVAKKEITTEPFVVYISGTDSRAGVKATARSDVNIIAVVNPKAGKILLVSIPRDMYVQLHGTTGPKDKLTHAGIYGIEMSKATIEDFLGIDIDYTVKVSFATVVELVDQLDGIEITSDQELTLKTGDKTCHFEAGVAQKVDGDCALRFARERKSYETGDRHRGENQQQVITSIIGKLGGSNDYLLKLPAILDIAADTFETNLERENLVALIRMQLEQKIKWKVESIAVNGMGTYEPTYSMGANLPLYVMNPQPDTVKNATAKIETYLAEE